MTSAMMKERRGTLDQTFENIFIYTGNFLSFEEVEKIAPWDVQNLKTVDPRSLEPTKIDRAILSDPESDQAFLQKAKLSLEKTILSTAQTRIGGQYNQVTSIETKNVEINHQDVYVPAWIYSFSWRGRNYRILVNDGNGKIFKTVLPSRFFAFLL